MKEKNIAGVPVMEENELLFGASNFKNIVSIEHSENSNIIIYYREGEETKKIEKRFEPFLLVSEEMIVYGLKKKPATIRELTGKGFYRYLATFENWKALDEAIKDITTATGIKPSAANAPYLYISDPVHQYMLMSGDTLFKGMRFSDLKRLTIDIETDCGEEYDFSNARRESDRILLIGVNISSEPGVFEYASARDLDEKSMLLWLNEIIKKHDPDTIEGHNIFKFDIPYIAERAKRHKVKLDWGRDGSEAKFRKSRIQVAERTLDYTRCDIFGRNVVDTWILAQYYDVQARSLESSNLKHLAVHFNVAPPDRKYISHDKIKWCYENDYEGFLKYNKDDIFETSAISEILSYSYFIQSSIFPYSYQNTIVRGNATKINSLIMREYLRTGWSIPLNFSRREDNDFAGGKTAMYIEGIVKNVGHCDVRSLYPSIMLSNEIAPRNDIKGVFLPMLSTLRDFRIKAKAMMKGAKNEHDLKYFESLQGAFKILINSFYGYLGSSIHNFSDIEAAAKVTEIGRQTITKMVELLEKENCRPVEIDTDGVYFIPPEGVSTDEEFEAIVKKINTALTSGLEKGSKSGIEIEYDGRYKTMLSFKMKNYALLDYDGKLTVKGSALKSRGLEKYLRAFTHQLIYLMLNGQAGEIAGIYEDYKKRIESKSMSIDEICKTETLTESTKNYQAKIREKKRNPAAQYELAVKSGREYQAGDSVAFYVTGDTKKVTAYNNCKLKEDFDEKAPDYNSAYYADKLLQQYKKFSEIIDGGAHAAASESQAEGQGELF